MRVISPDDVGPVQAIASEALSPGAGGLSLRWDSEQAHQAGPELRKASQLLSVWELWKLPLCGKGGETAI